MARYYLTGFSGFYILYGLLIVLIFDLFDVGNGPLLIV